MSNAPVRKERRVIQRFMILRPYLAMTAGLHERPVPAMAKLDYRDNVVLLGSYALKINKHGGSIRLF